MDLSAPDLLMLRAGTDRSHGKTSFLVISWFDRLHSPPRATMSIPSREGLTQESSYKIEGLNVSVSREARVGRSGDSDRERRVASLLTTSGVGCTVKVCREMRRARRQRRAQAEPQPYYLFAYCAAWKRQLTVATDGLILS